MTSYSYLALAAIVLTSVGCSDGSDIWYTHTAINIDSNGQIHVTRSPVSLKQQLAFREALESQQRGSTEPGFPKGTALPQWHAGTGFFSDGCAWGSWSLYIWDQSNYSGNSACVYAYNEPINKTPDYATLFDLSQFDLTGSSGISWWSRIRSFWVPIDTADGNLYFQDPAGNQEWWDCSRFSSQCWGHNASTLVMNSRYIMMDPYNRH